MKRQAPTTIGGRPVWEARLSPDPQAAGESNRARAGSFGSAGGDAPKTPRELARRLYEQSPLPVARIARMVGILESSLYRIARRERWRPRRLTVLRDNDGLFARTFQYRAAGADAPGLSPADVARAFVAPTAEALAAEREAIVARLWQEAKAAIAEHAARQSRMQESRRQYLEARRVESAVQALRHLHGAKRRTGGSRRPDDATDDAPSQAALAEKRREIAELLARVGQAREEGEASEDDESAR